MPNSDLYILLCVMPDDFTPQRETLGGERVKTFFTFWLWKPKLSGTLHLARQQHGETPLTCNDNVPLTVGIFVLTMTLHTCT